MQTKYQIVGLDKVELLTRAELDAKFDTSELEMGTHLREEIRGEPKIKTLCGPMWGGYRDSEGECIFDDDAAEKASEVWMRYETWKAYDVYSR